MDEDFEFDPHDYDDEILAIIDDFPIEELGEIIEEYVEIPEIVAGDIVCFHGEKFPTGGKVDNSFKDRRYKVKDVAGVGWLLLAHPLNSWVYPDDCVLVVEDE